jgi:hypothetical protein
MREPAARRFHLVVIASVLVAAFGAVLVASGG